MEQSSQNEKFIQVNLLDVYKKFELSDELVEQICKDKNNPYKHLMDVLSGLENKKAPITIKDVQKMFILLQFTKERVSTKYLAKILKTDGQTDIADKIVEFNQTEQLYSYRYGNKLEIRTGVKRSSYTGVFPMESDPRGVCLIIVNEELVLEEAEQMGYVFGKFHFKVRIEINKTAEEIKELFKETANSVANDKKMNAVITIAIAHGQDEMLLGRNYGSGNKNDKVELYELVDIFSEKNCPGLRDRPKVHIFNSCRIRTDEDKYQSGDRPVPRNSMIKFRDRLSKEWVNTNVNATVIYSCSEGQESFFAWDMPGFTYFGRAVTHTFAQFACQYHLDRLMTQVNYRLRMDERPVPEYPEVIHYYKMFDIYFNP